MALPKWTNKYRHNQIAKTEANPSDPTPQLAVDDPNRLAPADWGIREQKANANVAGYRSQDQP